MDADRFDRLVLTLTRARTRRSILGLLGVLGLTGLVARDVAAQECAVNGTRCGRATDPDCCSGRCVRKGDTNKKFCRPSPNQGTCTIEQAFCFDTSRKFPPCGSSNSLSCNCYVTTAGHSVCGAARDC